MACERSEGTPDVNRVAELGRLGRDLEMEENCSSPVSDSDALGEMCAASSSAFVCNSSTSTSCSTSCCRRLTSLRCSNAASVEDLFHGAATPILVALGCLHALGLMGNVSGRRVRTQNHFSRDAVSLSLSSHCGGLPAAWAPTARFLSARD